MIHFIFIKNYLCFWKQWYDQTSQPQDMTLPRVRYDRKNPLIRIIFKFEFHSINRVILYEYTLKQKKNLKPSVVTGCFKRMELKLRCEGNLLFRKHLNPSETSSKTSRVTLKIHDK